MQSLLKGRLQMDDNSPEGGNSENEDAHKVDFAADTKEITPTIPDAASSVSGYSSRQVESSSSFIFPHSNNGTVDSSSISTSSVGTVPAEFSPDLRQGEDVIDRGIVSLEVANDLVSLFMNELVQFFPVVILPPNTTALQLRRTKPVLFLSVIAAAAIAVDVNLAAILNREMVRLYATRFFIESEKSLELVQALLLMIVFYFPPDSPLKLQIYQYTHIAATMALEIGLASKHKAPKRPSQKKNTYDEHMAEQARAILGCYHFAATVAMKTRRPNLLLFNDWMSECVKHLGRSPHSLDRHLAKWFELQRITDEAMASFGLDDTSSATPLTESRIQAVLRWFGNRMQSWKDNIPPDMLTVPMILEYHYTLLAVYELAVGEGYRDPDAIKQKYYTLPPPDDDRHIQEPGPPLSAVRVDITMKWLNAAHEILDSFLSCDVETMRKIPNIMYSRVGVGLISLQKIYYSVRSGALGEVITPQTVNVDMYLDAMSKKLAEASGGRKYKIPDQWSYVVGVKARDWYNRFQQRQAQKEIGAFSQAEMNASRIQCTVSMHNNQPLIAPSDLSRMGSFDMAGMTGMTPLSSYDNMRGTYAVPTAMATPWPSDPNVMDVNQVASYATPVVPSQFPYNAQRGFPSTDGRNDFPIPPGTGMELDGWIPDGSIFGLPPLPRF